MNPACSEWQARRQAGLAAVFPSDEMTSITPLAVCLCVYTNGRGQVLPEG